MNLFLVNRFAWLCGLETHKKNHPHKMCIEILQMAYASWKTRCPDHVFEVGENLPPPMGCPVSHFKHPIAIWINASTEHYRFAIDVARMLLVRRDGTRKDLTSPVSPTLLNHVKRLRKAGPPPGMPAHCSYDHLVHLIESAVPSTPPEKRAPKTPPPPKRIRCIVAGTDLPDGIEGFPLAFGYNDPSSVGSALMDLVYDKPFPELFARSLPAVKLYKYYYESKVDVS